MGQSLSQIFIGVPINNIANKHFPVLKSEKKPWFEIFLMQAVQVFIAGDILQKTNFL